MRDLFHSLFSDDRFDLVAVIEPSDNNRSVCSGSFASMQQRRNPPLQAGQNGHGLPASSVQASHMNGIGPNQLQGMGYPNSMMPGGTQGVRRTVSQPR
jgi:hypothetical protein